LCPICRQLAPTMQDSTCVQLHGLTVSHAIEVSQQLGVDYPFGARLMNGEVFQGNEEILVAVREAILAVDASRLSLVSLRRVLSTRLTMVQYQFVFIELFKDTNLHDVLRALDSKRVETITQTRTVQTLVDYTMGSADKEAITARAVISTVGDTVFTGISRGLAGLSSFNFFADGVSNMAMFSIFSAVEVYRWWKDKSVHRTTNLVRNIGEHAVGAVAGYGGGYAGCTAGVAAGASLGSIVPILGTAIGGVIGGIIGLFLGSLVADATGRWAYRELVPNNHQKYVTEEEQFQQNLTPKEVAERCAAKFNINFRYHSYSEAHHRYRTKLLADHPDKAPFADETEKERRKDETRDNMACWMVVRQYYMDEGLRGEHEEVEEAFIEAFVLKVYDAVLKMWATKRSWFGERNQFEVTDPVNQRVETIMVVL
jgi:hypothetical protein